MTLSFGSVCSGIEAASVAWDVLGWKAAWLSEIDKAACEVLAYRFPDVPNHGDMLLLAAKVRARAIPAPDILVGGTPCQSFSVAGLRGGLKDARGQLTIAFIDLANAIDEIRAADGLPPVIIIWENVPGVLSHVDNPLGCFLAGLAGDDEPLELGPRPEPGKSNVYWSWSKKEERHGPKWTNAGAAVGPQRAVAWRVLDAQYFGLAQRRRRVFVVSSARQGFDPAAVLLEFDGVRRDSAPSREAGEGITHPVAPCLTSSGRGVERTGDTRGQDAVVAVIDDGRSPGLGAGVEPVPTWWDGRDVSQTLDAVLYKGQTMPEKNRFPAVLQPVTYRLHSMNSTAMSGEGDAEAAFESDVARCLDTTGGFTAYQGGEVVMQPICFSSKDYGADASVEDTPTLRAGGHAESHANAGVPPAVCYGLTTEQTPKFNEDCALTLTKQSPTGGGQPQAVAYSVALRGREGGATAELGDDLAGCLRASGGGGDKPHVLTPCYPIHPNALRSGEAKTPSPDAEGRVRLRDPGLGIGQDGDPADTITAAGPGYVAAPVDHEVCVTGSVTHTLKAEGFDASEDGTGRGQPIVPSYPETLSTAADVIEALSFEVTMAVRRLMPVECERLQGFPDDWTLVPTGKKGKPAADGPRYKQCGNSMATRVMRWLGVRVAWQIATLEPGHNGGPPLDDAFADILGVNRGLDPLDQVLG